MSFARTGRIARRKILLQLWRGGVSFARTGRIVRRKILLQLWRGGVSFARTGRIARRNSGENLPLTRAG